MFLYKYIGFLSSLKWFKIVLQQNPSKNKLYFFNVNSMNKIISINYTIWKNMKRVREIYYSACPLSTWKWKSLKKAIAVTGKGYVSLSFCILFLEFLLRTRSFWGNNSSW